MTALRVTVRDTEVAHAILERVLPHRRRSPAGRRCLETPCLRCADTHVDRVAHFVAAGDPVSFVLPAFPTKSPNPAKVLGVRPDKAEELASRFLSELRTDIAKINRAMHPHWVRLRKAEWFSRFSIDDRVFLVGDACHLHSVNVNTGPYDQVLLVRPDAYIAAAGTSAVGEYLRGPQAKSPI